MADLKTAGQKFDDAITRLETALNTWSESVDQKASDGQEERHQLKSDLDRLTREHQELQSRHEALKRVTETVSGELDATVGQLADLLEV